MRRAIVPVTAEFVIELFHLPAETRLIGAAVNRYGELELTLEHPDLQDQPEGSIGHAEPMFQNDEHGVPKFLKWNQR